MIPSLNKTFSLPAAVLLLTACALGGASDYRLITLQVPRVDSISSDDPLPTLAIARPQTDRTRDSSRILVRRDRTLMPWSSAAWIDRAPDLVQDLLVDYLNGRVARTGRAGSLPAEYRLDLNLRRFELVEGADGLTAEIELVARLFAADEALLGNTRLQGVQPAGGHSLEAAAAALEEATADVFGQLAGWLRPRLENPDAEAGAVAQ
ncbi:MAG: ABC-type transport auxiliary lipoprotein family protein [Xanthomonadales bacterium]|nr:ABC-type transport auxiliary lipoprotein family protein [Xanthomonadales bacterium]